MCGKCIDIAEDLITYKIVRVFKDYHHNRIIKRSLTLEDAQAHCKDPETSSSTCGSGKMLEYTDKYGDWFDSYSKE